MKNLTTLGMVPATVMVGMFGLAMTIQAESGGNAPSSSILYITRYSLEPPAGEGSGGSSGKVPDHFVIEHNGAGLEMPVYVQELTGATLGSPEPIWTTRPNGPHASPYDTGPAVGTRFFRLTSTLPSGGSADATSQEAVFSQFGIGFYTLHLTNHFNLIANQLNNGDNNINTILPGFTPLPNGTSLLKWPPCGFHYSPADIFFAGLGWFDDDLSPSATTLSPGEGAFLELPPGAEATIVLVGNIPHGTLTLDLCVGLQIISHLTPQEIGLDQAGFPACDGDSVTFWRPGTIPGVSQGITYFGGIGWIDEFLFQVDPTPALGEAFFYERAAHCGPVTWVRIFNVD